MPSQKLAILGSRGIPARYGGFETFAEELAVRLASSGLDVTVFCESDHSGHAETYRGVKLVYVRAPSLGPLSTIIFDSLCLWRAREGYSIVYMLGYGTSFLCFLPRLKGAQVWINMDGVEWARSKWNKLAKLWFKTMELLAMWTPNRIIADAQGIRQHLRGRHRRMPPCTVIGYGAPIVDHVPDSAVLSEYDLRANDYYLIVCRLEPENHVLEILRGFVASASKKTLAVLGDYRTDTAYVKRLLAIEDARVRFLGTEYDAERLQSLRFNCFAYFHGHSVGGTNPSLLEAMGCGNPVIAYDVSFNREVAADSGLYFSEPPEIPGLIHLLESETGLRESMQRQAGEIIRSRYTWEKITGDYLKLARQVEEALHSGGSSTYTR